MIISSNLKQITKEIEKKRCVPFLVKFNLTLGSDLKDIIDLTIAIEWEGHFRL